ncbi:Chitinase 1 [Entophlyctis luteolus]|nr:Chitinase 1 [Entophlyctis luteolus]
MEEAAKSTPKAHPRRIKIIIACVVLAVIAVVAALIGYFVSKNNSSSSSSSATSSSAASPTTTASGGNSSSTSFRLFGYFGADAMGKIPVAVEPFLTSSSANGVDLVEGPLTPTSNSSYYQKDLKYYCDTGYFNTINIAFLNLWGGGAGHFQITLGGFSTADYVSDGTYVYKGDGKESNDASVVTSFENIGKDITYCQSKAIKVLMSLGGDKVSNYSFSTGDGKLYANLWYNMFLEGTSTVRPFGAGVVLDGIELDVEKNLNYPGTQPWNQEMIDLITTLRSLSPKTTLAIVPQCYLGDPNYPGKDANVGDVIPAVADILDYLIVQYYNNAVCSYPVNFNFDAWTKIFSGKIVVGLAGDWTSAISGGFLEPGPLQAVFDQVKTSSQFLGFSVYDVSSSTAPALEHTIANYNTTAPVTHYAQTLRNVLDGVVVGSGYPSQTSLGDQSSSSKFTYRCGATWAEANATCGVVCKSTGSGCATNQICAQYVTAC